MEPLQSCQVLLGSDHFAVCWQQVSAPAGKLLVQLVRPESSYLQSTYGSQQQLITCVHQTRKVWSCSLLLCSLLKEVRQKPGATVGCSEQTALETRLFCTYLAHIEPASVVMTIMIQSEILQCKRRQQLQPLPPEQSWWAAGIIATACLAAISWASC